MDEYGLVVVNSTNSLSKYSYIVCACSGDEHSFNNTRRKVTVDGGVSVLFVELIKGSVLFCFLEGHFFDDWIEESGEGCVVGDGDTKH